MNTIPLPTQFLFTYDGQEYSASYSKNEAYGATTYWISIEDEALMKQLGTPLSVTLSDAEPLWKIAHSGGSYDSQEKLRYKLVEGLETALQIWRFIFYLQVSWPPK